MKRITVKNNQIFISGAINQLKALGVQEIKVGGFYRYGLALSGNVMEFFPEGGDVIFYTLNAQVKYPEKARLNGMSRSGGWRFTVDTKTPEEALRRLEVHLRELKSLLKQECSHESREPTSLPL